MLFRSVWADELKKRNPNAKDIGVAYLHNRYHKIVLPNALSFFGGSRFIPIISTVVYMFVGIAMYFVWPVVQSGIFALGGLGADDLDIAKAAGAHGVAGELGHIPQTGEKLRWNTFTFEIVDMDGARIDKILACETSEKTNQNP